MKKYNLNYMDEIIKDDYIEYSEKSYKSDKKLNVEEIPNAIVLPADLDAEKNNTLWGNGGVVNQNKEYIESSAQIAENMCNRVYGNYDFDKYDEIDEEVIYMNYFLPHWGHFLIDIVNRLWYAKKCDKKIVYTALEKHKIEGNFLEFLNLLGIEEERLIRITKPTKFKKVIIPESSIYPGKYYTKEFVEIFDAVKSKVEIDTKMKDKKIYFSRKNIQHELRKEVGEKDIEKFFKNNNYDIVCPETLSLTKQIQIIKSAKEMVAFSGTLPHNMLFAENGANIIIINKTPRANAHQFLIDDMRELNVTYIDCHISLFPVFYGPGPFVMTINDNLKRFAKDNNYYLKVNDKINKLKNKIKIVWYLVKYYRTYITFPKDGKVTSEYITKIYNYYRTKL